MLRDMKTRVSAENAVQALHGRGDRILCIARAVHDHRAIESGALSHRSSPFPTARDAFDVNTAPAVPMGLCPMPDVAMMRHGDHGSSACRA
jgi:hypothetical protein